MNENIKNSENIKENIGIESKILLKKLKNEISENFGINDKEIEKIIINNSLVSIENLRLELQNQNKNFGNNEIIEIFSKLSKIKKLLEKISKDEIKNLKNEIEKEINVNNFSNNLEKYLPRKLIKIARNPEKPHEHLIGASLGIANSTIAIGESILKVGAGIIKAPYDLYLIASGKAELENTKRI